MSEEFVSGNWTYISKSRSLKKGKILSFKHLKKDFVLYRGENGVLTCMEAHCPHLGAHLGYGGKIIGNEIQCPFHGWKFDSSGRCSHIPYCEQIPQKAKIKIFEATEKENGIFVAFGECDTHD